MYCVYKHYCPQTKKVYIGLTKFGDNPNKKWANGKGYEDNKPFYNDIIKYGWDNFTHEILAKDLNQHEANKLESYYISFYNSTDPSHGYNRSNGVKAIPSSTLMYIDTQGRLRSGASKKDALIHYIQKYRKYYG